MPFKLHDYHRATAITFLALPLSLWADHQYRSMPLLSAKPVNHESPSLSIIVPARDEAENLRTLLPSLKSIDFKGAYEIIVVDDNSSDKTASIAEDHGVKVIRLQDPSPGCLGKPNACHQGALMAQGDWLLFTDADTIHTQQGPVSALTHAIDNQLDGLSLFIKQDCKGVLDRLALTIAFAGLFAGRDPRQKTLNGQYILLRRDVYMQSGGFAAVCNQPMEDLALGDRLNQLGYNVPMMVGEQCASVRMYRDTKQLWHGLIRLGSGTVRWSGIWSLLTITLITALMSPLVVLSGVLFGQLHPRWLPLSWLATTLSALPWAKRYGKKQHALLAPIGALFVQLAAVYGILTRLFRRKQQWKGRRV